MTENRRIFAQFFASYKRMFVILGCLLVVQAFLAVRVVWLSYESKGSSLPSSGSGSVTSLQGTRNELLSNFSLSFKPDCDIDTKDAASALSRAKTDACKRRIADTVCKNKSGHLYPDYLPRFCVNNVTTYGKYIGCFEDNAESRILAEYYITLKDLNSPKVCLDICLQYGYQYAGVQYGVECFCGDSRPATTELKPAACNMDCPSKLHHENLLVPGVSWNGKNLVCGGYLTMNVFETGVYKEFETKPKVVHHLEDIRIQSHQRKARVVFFLTLNGRAKRQVIRLIKALYHRDHYFLIHVDVRQNYLYRELQAVSDVLPGQVKFMKHRRATIWGGASLLDTLLGAMEEIVQNGPTWNWEWDYFINLSESDFPLKSSTDLTRFLTLNMGKNFLKSHGRSTKKFIQKQGLDKTFVECEHHMWRVGDRILPKGVLWDGGSDWVGLHRDFIEYLANTDDELIRGLKVVFRYTLLPAESFYHTALRNSAMCNAFVDNNLHVTNWNRKLGCKCQYKNIVDWCGCSPNVFRLIDLEKLKRTQPKLLFFGRKFEAIVNQAIINELETWVEPSRHDTHYSTSDRYWQSLYSQNDGAYSQAALRSLAEFSVRSTIAFLRREQNFSVESLKVEVIEMSTYSELDVLQGILVYFEVNSTDGKNLFESFFRFQNEMIRDFTSKYAEKLVRLEIGLEYDQKEQLFRQYHRAIGQYSEPTLVCGFNTDVAVEAVILWISPSNAIVLTDRLNISVGPTTNFVTPALPQPLAGGKWTVKIQVEDETLALGSFFVFAEGESSPRPSREEGPGLLVEPASLSSQASHVDSIVSQFYSLQDVCHSKLTTASRKVGNLSDCRDVRWSSLSLDPKSTITGVSEVTGLLMP